MIHQSISCGEFRCFRHTSVLKQLLRFFEVITIWLLHVSFVFCEFIRFLCLPSTGHDVILQGEPKKTNGCSISQLYPYLFDP
jgi:hypothetical protein